MVDYLSGEAGSDLAETRHGRAVRSLSLWLGIPPGERPVNHYRLLGIEAFESNPEVIDNAADQRMLLLRTFQVGKYSDLSQKLLNEVAAAKVCLLRPEKKAAYDQQLRQQLQAKAESRTTERPEIDSQLARVLEQEALKGRSQYATGSQTRTWAGPRCSRRVGILVVIVVVWAATRKAPPAAQRSPSRRNGTVATWRWPARPVRFSRSRPVRGPSRRKQTTSHAGARSRG